MEDTKLKNYNSKLYLIYKSLGADLLFYYIIIYVFLEEIKGFNASQILLLDAMYPVFTILFNIPATILVEKIGKKNGMVFGNIFMGLSLVVIMLATNFIEVVVAYSVMSLGFCLKRLTEANILAEIVGITTEEEKNKYTSIAGKANRNYYLIDGISSFFTGITFLINPYLPIIISLSFLCIATILSMFLKLPKKASKTEKTSIAKEFGNHFKNLITSFKTILKSTRIKSILKFVLFFDGILYALYALRSSLLLDSIGMETEKYTILIAALTIFAGFSSTFQQKIREKLKNKTLTVLSSFLISTLIISGVVCMLNINVLLKIIIIAVMFGIQYGIQGTYEVLISLYIRNFTSDDIRIEVSSVYELFKNISQCGVSLFASILLGFLSVEYNFLILGVVFGIILFIVLHIIKNYFGLKPEEYSKKDVFENYVSKNHRENINV